MSRRKNKKVVISFESPVGGLGSTRSSLTVDELINRNLDASLSSNYQEVMAAVGSDPGLVRNEGGTTIHAGDPVYINGEGGLSNIPIGIAISSSSVNNEGDNAVHILLGDYPVNKRHVWIR